MSRVENFPRVDKRGGQEWETFPITIDGPPHLLGTRESMYERHLYRKYLLVELSIFE